MRLPAATTPRLYAHVAGDILAFGGATGASDSEHAPRIGVSVLSRERAAELWAWHTAEAQRATVEHSAAGLIYHARAADDLARALEAQTCWRLAGSPTARAA